MTFDPKSLLTAPPMTVDGLADKLAKIKAMGLGGAQVHLPDGQAINAVELVAHGEKPAHFVVKGK
jgi:hypothetical protein